MKTYMPKGKEIKRDWFLIDADQKNLGRLSTTIATILRGKHKPEFTPFMDMGDYVVIINAKNIEVTGKKRTDKIYKRHTGYPGGLRERTFEEMLEKKPEEILRHAVKGMLPKGKLGRTMIKKLRIYAGPEHNNQAQKPKDYEVKEAMMSNNESKNEKKVGGNE